MSNRFASLAALFDGFSHIGTALRASREYSRLSTTVSARPAAHAIESRLLPR